MLVVFGDFKKKVSVALWKKTVSSYLTDNYVNKALGADMRVFMLGWEFPPFISGGLGTACYGLTKAMDQLGIKVTFVLPKIQIGRASCRERV